MNENQGLPFAVDLDKAVERANLKLGLRYRGYRMITVVRADQYVPGDGRVTEAHELLDVVMAQEVEGRSEEVRDNGCTYFLNKHIKVKRAYLVFGLGRDKAFEELQRQLSGAEQEKRSEVQRGDKLHNEVHLLNEKLRDADTTNGQLAKAKEAAVSSMNVAQASARKMETDIAKIRKEIGEARYKEIVGS